MLERCEEEEEEEEERLERLEKKGELLKIGCTLWVELVELNTRPLTVVDVLEVSR